MKTPREIGHETRRWVDELRRESAYSAKPVPDLGEEAARRGMIEALQWVLVTGYMRSVADTLLIEAKLAELEKS